MSTKITPKENLSRDTERGWHDRAPRHGDTMPKLWQKSPKTAQVARVCHLARPNRAMWQGQAVPLGCLSLMCRFSWPGCATCARSRGTFAQRFFAALLASLALLSTKCRSSFRFFDKDSENTERCYMSKMYVKGG